MVKILKYQEADLEALLTLFLGVNNQILTVIDNYNEEDLIRKIEIKNQIYSLEYLVDDYIAHLKHHFNQMRAII